jgi:hypothetical protein
MNDASKARLASTLMDEVIWFADVLERTEEENKKFLDRNIALVREAEEVDQILGKALGVDIEDDCRIIQVVNYAELAAQALDLQSEKIESLEKQNELLENEIVWRNNFFTWMLVAGCIIEFVGAFLCARAFYS